MTPAQLRALIPVGWRAALDGNLPETALERLARALSDERRVMLPARDQWFRALNETPLSEVRAVILGQDPYPTQGQAEGLAFSVPDGVLPAAPPVAVGFVPPEPAELTVVPPVPGCAPVAPPLPVVPPVLVTTPPVAVTLPDGAGDPGRRALGSGPQATAYRSQVRSCSAA